MKDSAVAGGRVAVYASERRSRRDILPFAHMQVAQSGIYGQIIAVTQDNNVTVAVDSEYGSDRTGIDRQSFRTLFGAKVNAVVLYLYFRQVGMVVATA